MEMTGGQALARQLVAEGVSDLFGIPGVQLDWATDALLDVASDLRYVTPRHEQATSYMADGYARTTGKEGVCMVVPGPGLLNAMAGLSTAYACSSPVLCITGQIPSTQIGKGLGMLHEVPGQSDLLKSVTKWSRLARTPGEIPALVHEAFQQLRSGRPQPVAAGWGKEKPRGRNLGVCSAFSRSVQRTRMLRNCHGSDVSRSSLNSFSRSSSGVQSV